MRKPQKMVFIVLFLIYSLHIFFGLYGSPTSHLNLCFIQVSLFIIQCTQFRYRIDSKYIFMNLIWLTYFYFFIIFFILRGYDPKCIEICCSTDPSSQLSWISLMGRNPSLSDLFIRSQDRALMDEFTQRILMRLRSDIPIWAQLWSEYTRFNNYQVSLYLIILLFQD